MIQVRERTKFVKMSTTLICSCIISYVKVKLLIDWVFPYISRNFQKLPLKYYKNNAFDNNTNFRIVIQLLNALNNAPVMVKSREFFEIRKKKTLKHHFLQSSLLIRLLLTWLLPYNAFTSVNAWHIIFITNRGRIILQKSKSASVWVVWHNSCNIRNKPDLVVMLIS